MVSPYGLTTLVFFGIDLVLLGVAYAMFHLTSLALFRDFLVSVVAVDLVW